MSSKKIDHFYIVILKACHWVGLGQITFETEQTGRRLPEKC